MFENLNWWEIIVLLLLAMFIFGPDKLPKAISDGVRFLRNIRDMARNATGDLTRELGTDISIEDLNPKTFVRKHILSDADEEALRKPFQDLFKEVEDVTRDVDLGKELGPTPKMSLDKPETPPARTVKFDADAT